MMGHNLAKENTATAGHEEKLAHLWLDHRPCGISGHRANGVGGGRDQAARLVSLESDPFVLRREVMSAPVLPAVHCTPMGAHEGP